MKDEYDSLLSNLHIRCKDYDLFHSTEGWIHECRTNNIDVSSREDVESTDLPSLFRAIATIKDCTIKEFMGVMATADSEVRKKWDTPLISIMDLEKDGEKRLVHIAFKCKLYLCRQSYRLTCKHLLFLSATEILMIVFYRNVFIEGRTLELLCTSVPYELQKSYVRGSLIMAAWQLKELDNGNLLVSFIQQTDFGGSLHKSLTKGIMIDSALNVGRIAAVLKKTIE